MRYVILLSVLFLVLTTGAQTPYGKLYIYTGPGGVPLPNLGYISYPDEVFHTIDTVQLSDIAVIGNKLAPAAYLDVLLYDTSLYVVTDTLHNVYPRRITSWNDKLLLLSVANPYFRVYDAQGQNLLFSLDTLKIGQTPIDVAVSGDKAYLLLADSVLVVDLLQQDIVDRIPTPHPIPFAGYNTFLTEAGNNLYIDVEYVTGALRFSMMRMNLSTYAIDTVFHQEGYGNFSRPVLAGNDIYLGGFDTHYSIGDDSLYLSANQWSPFAGDYDPLSGSIFLIHTSGNGINYYRNGTFSDTVPVNGYVNKALFVPDFNITAATIEVDSGYPVYPNPAADFIHFELPDSRLPVEIELYNIRGQILRTYSSTDTGQVSFLEVGTWPSGIYLLKIRSVDQVVTTRFVK